MYLSLRRPMRTPYCIARLSWTTFKKVGANSDTIHVLDRLPTNDKPARSLRYKTSRVVRYETSAYRWNVTLAVRSRPLQCNLRYFTVRVALPTHGSPSVQKCQRLIHWQPTDSWKTDDQWSLISHCQSSMFMFFAASETESRSVKSVPGWLKFLFNVTA